MRLGALVLAWVPVLVAPFGLVQDDPISGAALTQIAELAVKHRLPSPTGFPRGADYGILLAYDLFITLKTAKALGLTIPPALLLRADRVIE